MRDATNITRLVKIPIDFIGFIFHEKSSRNVVEKPSITIPKNIQKVGVFVDKPMAFILQKATVFNLDYIQLHGNESPQFCKELSNHYKIIKAFNIKPNFDFKKLKSYENYCELFLFDAFGKKAGGNGTTFNWELLQKYHLFPGTYDKEDLMYYLAGSLAYFVGRRAYSIWKKSKEKEKNDLYKSR